MKLLENAKKGLRKELSKMNKEELIEDNIKTKITLYFLGLLSGITLIFAVLDKYFI